MNKLDKDYQALLQDILENGVEKSDRTGTGTISVFGRQIRHNMQDGFPLLTTKRMAVKTCMTELKWFLKGDTNIKYLVDNGCNIWNGDAYKNYLKGGDIKWLKQTEVDTPVGKMNIPIPYTQEEFIDKIKTDDEFAKKWGELGPIYGAGWRNWGGHKDIKQTGFLHKTNEGWTVKWSDLHSFANGTEWTTTLIQDSDQSLYSDEDEGKQVNYKHIIHGYDEKSYSPISVVKVIDDKFDKYVGGVDQISSLIHDLKTNPDSRRHMVSAWNVGELDQMTLPPCHYGFQVYTRELSESERFNWYGNKIGSHMHHDHIVQEMNENNVPKRAISLMWNQRSVDTFLGLPFNIASYGMLLHLLAEEVNMVPEELVGNLGDVHLYKNHLKQATEQIRREPYNLPHLTKLENVDVLNGEFEYTIEYYESHPRIEASLSN